MERREVEEDEQAVRDFLEGDGQAFERLVHRYRKQVYGICYRFTGNHHDADDLAQEVFLRVFRGLPRFRGGARFSTWLYRVAVNRCLSWVTGRGAPTEELTENVAADPRPGPMEHVVESETSRAIQRIIDRLPPRQRMTLVLRIFHDLSYREISQVLGSPLGTVKANVFFALRNLRKEMAGREGPKGPI